MANHDYNITPPNRNATNIQAAGAPRVNFQAPAIADNPWGGLAKTVDVAAQVMSVGRKSSAANDAARGNFDESLKQIYGLVKDGSYSEADYRKLVREADGKAQRDGVISAWQNWSAQHDVDEERTKIRIGAYAEEMNKAMNDMSNPSSKFATTFQEEDKKAFEALKEFTDIDSQGNPVTLDTSTMSPIELILFSKGKMATKFAVDSAVNKLKSDRMIQSGILRGQANIADHVSKMVQADSLFAPAASSGGDYDWDNFGHGVKPNPGDAVRDLSIKGLKDEFLKLRELNVPNPNEVFVTAVASAVNKIIVDADITGKGDEIHQVGDVLDALEEDFFSVREDDAGEIPFASVGTGTYDALESIRGGAQGIWDDKIVAWNAELPDREKDLKLEFMKKYRDQKALDKDFFKDPNNQEAFMDDVVDSATAIGVGDISQYRTQVEGLWKINPLVAAPEIYGDAAKKLWESVYSTSTLTHESGADVQAAIDLAWNSDALTYKEYEGLSNALESNLSALTTKENAARVAVDKAADSIVRHTYTTIEKSLVGDVNRMSGKSADNVFTPDPESAGDLRDFQLGLVEVVMNGGKLEVPEEVRNSLSIEVDFMAHTKIVEDFHNISGEPSDAQVERFDEANSWLKMLKAIDLRLGRSLVKEIRIATAPFELEKPDKTNLYDMSNRSTKASNRFRRVAQVTAAIHSMAFGEQINVSKHSKAQASALQRQWLLFSNDYTPLNTITKPVK